MHVIASDAHDDKHRKPILSEARDAVSRNFGADFAQALVLENPAAIIAGHPLFSSRENSRDTSQNSSARLADSHDRIRITPSVKVSGAVLPFPGIDPVLKEGLFQLKRTEHTARGLIAS